MAAPLLFGVLAVSPPPRRRRWPRRVAVGALSLLVLVGVGLWLLGTEAGLRLAVRQLAGSSGGSLVIEGVHGSLYGPVQAERVTYRQDGRRVVADGLVLDWSPWSLLQGRLHLTTVTLNRLTVDWPATSGNASRILPADLRLPLRPSVDVLRIDHVLVTRGASSVPLQTVQLRLRQDGGAYRLALQHLDTPWGTSTAEVSLARARPFALQGHADLTRADPAPAYTVRADATGTLADLRLSVDAVAGAARARLQGQLAPFAPAPLVRATLSVQGLDPSGLRPGLPVASLSGEAHVQAAEDGGLDGSFELVNAAPGPADRQRLPVRSVSGGLRLQGDALAFADLKLVPAGAGAVDGEGVLRGGRLRAQLKVQGLDLAGLVSSLRATVLNGDLQLDAGADGQRLEAQLQQEGYGLVLKARQAGGELELSQARVQRGKARLDLTGRMALTGDRRFQARAVLHDFDPAAFGDYSKARLNADASASGTLAPTPVVTLHYAVSDSTLRNAPLAGQGQLTWVPGRITATQAALNLGRTRLSVAGAFGATGDQLQWALHSSDLAVLGPAFGGRLEASGTVRGSVAAPSGEAALQASALRWGERLTAAQLNGHAKLAPGAAGTFSLTLRGEHVTAQGWHAAAVSVAAEGTRARHTVDVQVRDPDQELTAAATGGYDAAGWSGQLRRLDVKGDVNVNLRAPAELRAAPGRLELNGALLTVNGGEVNVQQLSLQGTRLTSRGELRGVPLAALQRWPGWPDNVSTNLVVGGHWSVRAGDTLEAAVKLQRESGDVTVDTAPATALGLDRLDLSVDVAADRLHARLDAHGSTAGTVVIEGRSRLERRAGRWGLPGNAPLTGEAHLDMPSLAWLAPLLGAADRVALKGAAGADLQVGGTLAVPELNGTVRADGLGVALPEQGMDLSDGVVRAELAGRRLTLTQLSLHGGDGLLRGEGSITWGTDAPAARLTLTAERLRLLSRPDRLLVVSGSGEARMEGKQLRIEAKVKADRGSIELPRPDTPTLSSDVVVLGQPAQTAVRRHTIATTLDLDLGDKFTVRGRGLDAQLTGRLRIQAAAGSLPQGSGTIRVQNGTYAAYGQRLDIERGILNFQGPLDNPALNIVALRRNLAVEAGVAISGTAAEPQVRLVSEPPVPDSEKLSWLVLGHGLDNASGQDYSVLQAAAGALLASGESVSLQTRLAEAAGLDELSVRGDGSLESTVVALGKRLSSRAFLSFEQGLTGADSLVKVTYTLTRRLSVQAQTGTDNALDLFYTFSFD